MHSSGWLHRPASLIWGRNPLTKGWVGPRAGLVVLEYIKYFLPTGTRTPDHPASGTHTILTMLLRLQKFNSRTGHEDLTLAALPSEKKPFSNSCIIIYGFALYMHTSIIRMHVCTTTDSLIMAVQGLKHGSFNNIYYWELSADTVSL
jgi:hypothetical protein